MFLHFNWIEAISFVVTLNTNSVCYTFSYFALAASKTYWVKTWKLKRHKVRITYVQRMDAFYFSSGDEFSSHRWWWKIIFLRDFSACLIFASIMHARFTDWSIINLKFSNVFNVFTCDCNGVHTLHATFVCKGQSTTISAASGNVSNR